MLFKSSTTHSWKSSYVLQTGKDFILARSSQECWLHSNPQLLRRQSSSAGNAEQQLNAEWISLLWWRICRTFFGTSLVVLLFTAVLISMITSIYFTASFQADVTCLPWELHCTCLSRSPFNSEMSLVHLLESNARSNLKYLTCNSMYAAMYPGLELALPRETRKCEISSEYNPQSISVISALHDDLPAAVSRSNLSCVTASLSRMSDTGLLLSSSILMATCRRRKLREQSVVALACSCWRAAFHNAT